MRKSNLIAKAMFSAVSLLLLVSPSAQAKGGDVWHTVRGGVDIPWTPFLEVGGEAGYPGRFIDVSISGRRNGELHFVGSSPEGRLWHTIRYPDSYWSPVEDLTELAGQPGYCSGVGTAFTGDTLHVVTESSGRLWHTMQNAEGAWSKFEVVGDRAGQVPTDFIDIGLSGKPDGELHVVAVAAGGKTWHTVRSAGGGWQEFSAVSDQAGDPGPCRSVAAAFIGDALHVIAGTDLDGKLWHTVRNANGAWSKFKDISQDGGGYPDVFDDVSIAGDDLTGDLHVVTLFRAIDAADEFTPRGPWHATRKGADGTWTPFEDVTAEAGTPQYVTAVETALAGQSLHIAALTAP